MILYLHGFRSSAHSFKAQAVKQYVLKYAPDTAIYIPDLAHQPADAIQQLTDWYMSLSKTEQHNLCIIGSSLGGFYATVLAERWMCRAIVLNPAVHAERDLRQYLGWHTTFDGLKEFELTQSDIYTLQRIKVPEITHPKRYFLVACTGDELLSYQEMLAFYPNSHQYIIQGSDHGISDFELHLDRIMQFALAHPQ